MSYIFLFAIYVQTYFAWVIPMVVLPPILKSQILEAQANTRSNMAAARYLNVPYGRYRQYAKLYGLFDSHLNQTGVGISKGFSSRPTSVKLKDIFANKHPNYPLNRLKRRLIQRNLLLERCSVCGFSERRVTDGRIPLILTFKDGKRGNMAFDNLHLLCYNCMFLTTGLPSLVNRRQLDKFARDPHRDSYPGDWHDASEVEDLIAPVPDEPDLDVLVSGTLPDDLIAQIQQDVLADLDPDNH